MYISAYNSGIFTIPIDQTFENSMFTKKKIKHKKNEFKYLNSDEYLNFDTHFYISNLFSNEGIKKDVYINSKSKNLIFTQNLSEDWKMLIVIKQLKSYLNLLQNIYN